MLPPIHIKLGLTKNFVKALDREGRGFAFFDQKFQQKSLEKIKAGIFDGPQIKELIKTTSFDDALNPAKLYAWFSIKSVIANFLGNHRSSQYQKVVDELMENFCQIGACMSVKMHSSGLIWTIFQKIVETSMKNRVSAFTKISVIWRNAIKTVGMSIFWPTTAGA